MTRPLEHEAKADHGNSAPLTAGFASGVPVWRFAGWVLIALALVAYVIAGDVRTGWVVGDVEPIGEEVALPRLGLLALALGLVLLARHQLGARRSLPDDRYRGPAVLILLGLSICLTVLVILPLRESINLIFTGGIPDWPPVALWIVATPLTVLLVAWLAVLRPRALHGLALFADARPIRHTFLGIGVGVITSFVVLVAGAFVDGLMGGYGLQVGPTGLEAIWPPSIHPLFGALVTAGLAPLAEETFFRGVVLNAWRREYGVGIALVGSSVLFGLVHFGLNPIEGLPLELPRLALLAVGGLVLGILAVRTGSLIAPIAAHAAMNGTLLALAVLIA